MKIISKGEVGVRFDEKSNHPVGVSADIFAEEYSGVIDGLSSALKRFGSIGIDGESPESDFCMAKWDVYTRAIVLVSGSHHLFSPDLVDGIREFLKKQPIKYRVILDGWFSRKESCYLFIDPDEIVGWFDDVERVSVFERWIFLLDGDCSGVVRF